MGHLEGAIEGLLEEEAAQALARGLAPDGLGAALLAALAEADAEADAVLEAAGVNVLDEAARGGIGLGAAAQDGEGARSSGTAADASGNLEPEGQVGAAPVGGQLELIVGGGLHGDRGGAGVILELIRHC